MESFKKKTATDKAIDLLTNALHDNEISSFIVMIRKQDSVITSADGDLFSQAASLVIARRKRSYKRIEILADDMEKAINDEESKDGKESHKDTPGDGEI